MVVGHHGANLLHVQQRVKMALSHTHDYVINHNHNMEVKNVQVTTRNKRNARTPMFYVQVCTFALSDNEAVLVFKKSFVNSRYIICLLYTSPSPRDATLARMPSSA